MKTLAVLTNGGDTCALNASLRSIRDNAYNAGYKKIYGIRRGYQGLIDGWIDDITHKEIDPRIGGSCLGSLRVSPTDKSDKGYIINEDRCAKMAQCIKDYRIDVLLVIGGDGTLQATRMFQEWVNKERFSQDFRPFHIVGFLKTIDNDIRTFTTFKGIEVSLCPGFPSAANKVILCAEDLRVTARTAERAFSVEIMGRDAGWLAAAATFGGAEILLVPEQLIQSLWNKIAAEQDQAGGNQELQDVTNKKEAAKREVTGKIINKLVDEIADFYMKNRNVLIAVAEGFEPYVDIEAVKSFTQVIHNLYGPRKKVGATEIVAILVSPVLEYYFWCFSRLCAHRYEAIGLSSMIECVLKEANKQPVGEKYWEAMKDPKHPLKGWIVENKLRYAFGLGEKGTATIAVEHGSQDAQESSLVTGNGDKRTPLIIPPYKFEIRPHRTDYLPRSGPPSPYDYKFAKLLGQKVGQMLLEGEFGTVPALKEVVPYDDLTLDIVKTVSIEDISTKNFESVDYFKSKFPLQIADRIINFFRTIMTGPKTLEDAIIEEAKRDENIKKPM